MIQSRIAAILSTLLVATVAARAQSDKMAHLNQQIDSKFAAADTNHDGKLTKDEAKVGMPLVYAHFDEIDTAHAGTITIDQIKAYVASYKH